MNRYQVRAKLLLLVLICLVVAGCSAPPPYDGSPLEVYDETTKYSAIDHHDGYEIHMFYERDNDTDVAQGLIDLISAFFGVPGGGEMTVFRNQCKQRVYSVAYQYAEKLDQLEPYLQWERAKRLRDEISSSPDRAIRLNASGGSTFKCHAYGYFRWKTHASQ